LADAEHEILMENNSMRVCFWQAFDAFVSNRSRDLQAR
jgi:hypothetical protein